MSTATAVAAPASANPIDALFATVKNVLQVVEADVISLVQNIEAGAEVAAEDLQWAFSWLGGHIGQINETITAVQTSVQALNAAGIKIPGTLTSAIGQLNSAAAGVTAALNDQALTANPSSAMSAGYTATKALSVAASTAASIAAMVQATTAPPVAQPAGPAIAGA